MRICIHKTTKHILEMQSDAVEGTLIQNAINAGYALVDIEEKEVDEAGYEAAKAIDPDEIALKEKQEIQRLKQKEAHTQLTLNDLAGKTYAQVETWVDNNITDLASQVAFDKKVAKIVLAILKKMDLGD